MLYFYVNEKYFTASGDQLLNGKYEIYSADD